jgi:hypothetical protein
MRAAVIDNGIVVNIIEVQSLDFLPGLVDAAGAGIGDRWDGAAFSAPPLPPAADLIAMSEEAIDAMLDAKAIEWGYKDGDRLARYASSGNAQWKAEAQAFLAWADACWEKALDIKTQAEASGQIPSMGDVLAQMPTITRPTAS